MTEVFTPPDVPTQLARFSPADTAIAELTKEYLPLRIDGLTDRDGYVKVHRARMDIRSKRCQIEKVRKELKADALAYGRQVDGEAKRLTVLLEPIETHLLKEEKAIDDEKERIRNEKRLKEEAEAKAKAEAEAEQAKHIADVKAARIKAEQDAENERLRVEREEWEAQREAAELRRRKVQEKLDRDRRAFEEAQAAEETERREAQEELEAQHRAHEEKIEAERLATEAEAQRLADIEQKKIDEQRREIEAQQEAYRQKIEAREKAVQAEKQRLANIELERVRAIEMERAKAEAAERARQETEARIAMEAEEAEAQARAEEEARLRAEALKPDREKLLFVADEVAAITVPEVSEPAQESKNQVDEVLTNAEEAIRAIVEKMEWKSAAETEAADNET